MSAPAWNCLKCGLTAAMVMMLNQVSMAGPPPKYPQLDPSKVKYLPPVSSDPVIKIPPGLKPKFPILPADPVVKIPPGLKPKFPILPVDPIVKIPPGLKPKFPILPVDPIVKIPPGLKPKFPILPVLPDPPVTKPSWPTWPMWPADPGIYVDWYFPAWWFCCCPEYFDEWYYTYWMWDAGFSPEVLLVSTPAPKVVTLGIAVLNPESIGATIPFTVDGTSYELAPGARLELDPARSQIIEFGRGESLGNARYKLADGLFTFAVTEKGLELYRGPYRMQEAPSAPILVMH